MYLHRQDDHHPSFIVYIETVNEIYSGLIPKLPSNTMALKFSALTGLTTNIF